jgi:hypothetical protein
MKQLPSLRRIEVQSYKLQPGTAEAFHAAASEPAVPLLQRWKTGVVAFGKSAHEKCTCFPLRACGTRADLEAQQNAFYGSQGRRHGPRDAIVGRIASHLRCLLWLSATEVEDLRNANAPAEPDAW